MVRARRNFYCDCGCAVALINIVDCDFSSANRYRGNAGIAGGCGDCAIARPRDIDGAGWTVHVQSYRSRGDGETTCRLCD